MDDTCDLAGLRALVTMLADEHHVEGWAAYGGQPSGKVLGLVLLTDQRVIFVDAAADMAAFPISKISSAEVIAPCAVTFTTWYGTMALSFDNPGVLSTMLNLVRQDPAWTAKEILHRQTAHRAGGPWGTHAVGAGPVATGSEDCGMAHARGTVTAPLETA